MTHGKYLQVFASSLYSILYYSFLLVKKIIKYFYSRQCNVEYADKYIDTPLRELEPASPNVLFAQNHRRLNTGAVIRIYFSVYLTTPSVVQAITRGATPVTVLGGPEGCETSRPPHFLDNRLTDVR
jgi:hypothetical protein